MAQPHYSPLGMEHTLENLLRDGDIEVSDNGHLICIDMVHRRSNCQLYGTGNTLTEALDDIYNEVIDHSIALEHLEGLGLDVEELGRLIDASGEFDSDLQEVSSQYAPAPPLDPSFTTLPSAPVVDDQSWTDPGIPPSIDTSVTPIEILAGLGIVSPQPVMAAAGQPDRPLAHLTPAEEAAIDRAVDAAIDASGEGYVLALLIPVREGRA